jgi:translocation and assembly module TamB
MSETSLNTPPPAEPPESPPPAGATPRRRILWNIAGLAVALIAAGAMLAFWVHTQQFQDLVRNRVARELQAVTGGRVEIGSFHVRPGRLDAEARNIVIHGDEQADEDPYARIEDLKVGLSILGFWSPTVHLRGVDVVRPRMHIIFYPDGATNQPRPGGQGKPSGKGMDTLFKLQIGHFAVEDGMIHVDNRAAALDFQNRYQPLDFRADDLSAQMSYVEATASAPEHYHAELGARDFSLTREGTLHEKYPAVHGVIEAAIDLERNAARITALRLTSKMKGAADRVLTVTGSVADFNHPAWKADLRGEVDMRLLDPALGYNNAPEGLARINLAASGQDGGFRVEGTLNAAKAAYIGTGVTARGIDLSTHVLADEKSLRITGITARLAPGGEITGEVILDHWLPPAAPAEVRAAPAVPKTRRHFGLHANPPAPPPAPMSHSTLVKKPNIDIPIDGRVNAEFHNVSIDTILDMVSQPPFQRLGIATTLNGPAHATWTNGDYKAVVVTSNFGLAPSPQLNHGEVPASGSIVGTYTQRTGSVDVQTFDLQLPSSHIGAHGLLGAYPLTSPTALALNFQSRNLNDFDTVLRALGLRQRGKSGTAALPVSLEGKTDFNGNWSGSLLSPRLDGTLAASDITVELPGLDATSGEPKTIHLDSISAQGTYDAEHIAIVHADLRRGTSHIQAEGTLSAAVAAPEPAQPAHGPPHNREKPAFGAGSVMQARVQADKLSVDDLQAILGTSLPVTGTLDAQFTAGGPVHSPEGSGWAQLSDGSVQGETVTKLRVQGALSGKTLRFSSFTASLPSGPVNGSGSYDFGTEQFEAQAHSTGLQLAEMRLLQGSIAPEGKLQFSLTASGTRNDPRVEGNASVSELIVRGQPLGSVTLKVHSTDHLMVYDADAHTEAALIKAHGDLEMKEPWVTRSRFEFSQVDAGAFLRMGHVESITAKSALSGSAKLEGPLSRPAEMHGELLVDPSEIVLAGVHLRGDAPLHATLAQSSVNLDPVHITGEDTDFRARGSLELKDKYRMDLAGSGTVNLKLAQTLDPDITASGESTFEIEAHGTISDPGLRGRLVFKDGAIALEDLPNGLSQINGTLEFNQNRLEVKSLTAMTGGGQLNLGGYLTYQHGVYADITATGRGVRIRYPQGVSSQADADLHLQGSPSSMLLSGKVLITRFSVSPDLDIAALAAQSRTVQPVVQPDAPSNRVRLDVRIQSSPQLNFQNAYAKLAGDVDLHLRGTLASPSLLGRVSVTEGSATIAGTRYELQRGEITFTNPVRIQPNIDLNATARVEDYDITLGLHGTPDKMSVSYRSDPPLPESDVVALLALGRTQSEQGIYSQQQQRGAGLTPSTDLLLGGALNATVSSRVQKLFGAGSVKVDPSYVGALGNSTTRLTVEEQIGKNVTLVYATSVDASAQQFLQADIAINRHVTLQVTRDESGVFSMVIKAVRRYR